MTTLYAALAADPLYQILARKFRRAEDRGDRVAAIYLEQRLRQRRMRIAMEQLRGAM